MKSTQEIRGKRRGARIKLSDLPEPYRSQAAAQLGHPTTRRHDPEPESNEVDALGGQASNPLLLVDPDCQVTVRIVRIGGRTLDGDNLAGGCKELRDSITAALGRHDDSEAAGMRWEYSQEPGEQETRIEMIEGPAMARAGAIERPAGLYLPV